MVDLKKGFPGESEEEIERWESDEICDGIFTLFGGLKIEAIFWEGERKWEGRTVESDREIEAIGMEGIWV